MEIKIFCQSCGVEILRADTDTLKSPLVGEMFQVKKDMEWALFSPHDTGLELTCPMCEWTFHEKGKIKVAVGGDFVFGIPEVIVPGILAYADVQSAPIVVAPPPPPAPPVSPLVEAPAVPPPPPVTVLVTDPALLLIQDQVEAKGPVEEIPTVKPVQKSDTDEDSEMEGKAPPGAVAVEPAASKEKNKGGRPSGSKNKGALYKNKRKKK